MSVTKRLIHIVSLILLFLSVRLFSTAQQTSNAPVQEAWTKDYEPFRIAGNLYYVGTYDLACYLIATKNGHILINTGVAESAPMIRSHIEKLGFHFSDLKILLTTQAHYDHVGAMAEIKKMTGAKMMIDEKDAPVLADGGSSDYAMGGKGKLFEPVQADRLLHDKDTVTLGDMHVVLLHHPGHTKGSSSFLFDVKDEHKTYRVLIANMPSILSQTKLSGMPGYPEVGKDYAYTLDALEKLKFDIWLSSHAGQFGLHEKHKPGDKYNPEVFIDKKGFEKAIIELKNDYRKRSAEK